MIRAVILLRFALRSGAIKGEDMQIFVDADACPAKQHYMAASVKIKGDGSGAFEKDDSDEKEILINGRERLRNPFF